ncbi:MAG: glycoside hydrolase [Gammaproteobacteria bacterium]|nr:glycoside hydrolase [Gammaproteobacteria bacterium]
MPADGSADGRIPVVFCWHMHQPEYRDLATGWWTQPWTYLHAIKDYHDMAAHLEAEPQARAVVNFSPILIEQLRAYEAELAAYLERGEALTDPLLAALAAHELPSDSQSRLWLATASLRANRKHLVDRFPAFRLLADRATAMLLPPARGEYFSDAFLFDLVTWYHLAWLGEYTRRNDTHVQALLQAEHGFTHEQRRRLLECIAGIVASLLARYRALAEAGRIELSVTPYAHPILPLMFDFQGARATVADAPLPKYEGYPGGRARAFWHVTRAVECFEREFGLKPVGCWPAEGGVDDATLSMLADAGFRWAATGGGVLGNTLKRGDGGSGPYLASGGITMFARNDELSDLIGFTYSDWHADDAVANLEHRIMESAAAHQGEPPLIAIIMDGENAWEYYPENGWYFLSALYRKFANHERIRLVTFSEYADGSGKPLPHVTPGSWVYGTFSTWIGDPDKNAAWDALCEVKLAADEVLSQPDLSAERRSRIEHFLAICEASDWFWWFGAYNPAGPVSDFEQLFRQQICHLYALLDRAAPPYLQKVLSHGHGDPEHGGTMRHSRDA